MLRCFSRWLSAQDRKALYLIVSQDYLCIGYSKGTHNDHTLDKMLCGDIFWEQTHCLQFLAVPVNELRSKLLDRSSVYLLDHLYPGAESRASPRCPWCLVEGRCIQLRIFDKTIEFCQAAVNDNHISFRDKQVQGGQPAEAGGNRRVGTGDRGAR